MSSISSNYRPASGLTQIIQYSACCTLQALRGCLFLPRHTQNVKKVGRFIRRPKQVCPQMSAHVGDALLGIRLGRGRWLRR